MQSYQLKYDLEHTASRNLKIKAGGALHFLLQDRAALITMEASLMWSLFRWIGEKCWMLDFMERSNTGSLPVSN